MIKRFFAVLCFFLPFTISSIGLSEDHLERDLLVRRAAINWIKASELEGRDDRLDACRQGVTESLPILDWFLSGEKIADVFMGSSLSFFIPDETLKKIQKIDQYMEKVHPVHSLAIGVLSSIHPRLQKGFSRASKWLASRLIKVYLPSRCEDFLSGIRLNISQAKFSNTDFIQLLRNQETGLSFDGVPEKIRSYLELILEEYYDHLTFKEKSKIIRGLLELPKSASNSEQLASVLMRSGPILQKSFQLFGSDVKDPLLLEVMGKLRSQIKPFAASKVNDIMSQELGGEHTEFFSSFDMQPIAAATIGQVHTGTLVSGEAVVVKIKRPGIENLAQLEIDLLRSLTEDAGILSFVDELENIMARELDFLLEKKHLREGQQVYQNLGSGRIKVISLLEMLEDSNNVIIMEKAKGKPIFAEVEAPTASLKRDALLELLEKWLEEAFFGSGFFHADLHGGNLFIESSTTLRRTPLLDSDFSVNDYLEEEVADYKLWLIDFGSVGTLTLERARQLLKLMIGLSFKSNDLVLNALQEMMVLEAKQCAVLSEFLDGLWKEEDDGDELTYLDSLFNKIITINLPLPKSLILFYRGKALIEKQIHGLNESLIEGTNGDVPAKYKPANIYRRVFKRNLVREVLPFRNLRPKNKRSLLEKDSLKVVVSYYFKQLVNEPEVY